MGPDEELRGLLPSSVVQEKSLQHIHHVEIEDVRRKYSAFNSLKSRLRYWIPVILVTAFFIAARCFSKCNHSVYSSRIGEHASTAKPSLSEWTDEVTFDNYSLMLRGQRIFLHSGEFHPWRLPVPDLWPDILEKAKAAGLNAVSIYTHMGLQNPAPGVVDFDGYRALKPFFEACTAVGLWVVVRPGPYINAETTAGGIAHWATSEVAGTLRTNATDWRAAYQDYMRGIIAETADYQITEGGPVIAIQIVTDNEYDQHIPEQAEYFQDLIDLLHDSPIVVPITYNDPNQGENFINGTGAVDLYGLDSYPARFDCSNPTVWNNVTTNYHSYHERVNPSQPFYCPEFQGGAFDPWGPSAPGYQKCYELTGPDFQSVFNLNLWAQNFKLINYYMLYGGTSWGALPFGAVYTSYDYGSPIAENRMLTAKYDELKRQAMFLRSTPDFYKTDWIADSSTGLDVAFDAAIYTTLLENPDSQARYYIVRHNDSTTTAVTGFSLTVQTGSGPLKLPLVASAITLGGRQSKLVVTDYAFGDSKALYSTAQVFFAGKIDGRDVLFLHGDPAQEHELTLQLTGTPNKMHSASAHVMMTELEDITDSNLDADATDTVVTFLSGIEGLITVYDSDTQLVLFADSHSAATFWAPTLAGAPDDPFANFWGLGTNASVLVGGPYLVRDAVFDRGTLALRGDLNESAFLTVIGPKDTVEVTWNGEPVDAFGAASSPSAYGGFVGQIGMKVRASDVELPSLEGWKYKDSLPEVASDFDDASWVLANHTETNIPFKMRYGDGRILYGCDYGFCENIVLWRGHFTPQETQGLTMNLTINGGEAYAASVWLNGAFLKTSYGNSTNNNNVVDETDLVYELPESVLRAGEDNVITVVQDNMGLDETGENPETGEEDPNLSKGPRGIRGFSLSTGSFGKWKVQGKIGGYKDYPDKVRGVMNEGGLYGERAGWHLPEFDTSSWVERELSAGLPEDTAGVGFFVTTFDLSLPEGYDIPLSFVFEEPLGLPYRAYLFVNGWMMGKRVGNLGPQAKFPVHEGILEYQGSNTVAVALWAMENVTVAPSLSFVVDGHIEGGVGTVAANNPVWTPQGREV
ncbi:glycoside hydrolase family 35 protein [Schizophyllum amplum]|uniref:beta-galactosidase n=1 Tax=Schizophyllum amplum TaxID=97359 RepID=A0A550CLW6_9AGAR|nr:glycoside hydrolase family 35 protein [Auriculariopsis ampla]